MGSSSTNMAEVSVNAWNNYDHWDKNKGLNVKIKSKEEVAQDKLRRKICIIAIIVIAVLILIIAITLAIVFGLPDPEPESIAPKGLKRFDPDSTGQDNSPHQCGWTKLQKNGVCDFTNPVPVDTVAIVGATEAGIDEASLR